MVLCGATSTSGQVDKEVMSHTVLQHRCDTNLLHVEGISVFTGNMVSVMVRPTLAHDGQVPIPC